ncbi:ABC transporter ATP-binding protein [Saccharopolyspora spinosa]|uniref:Peptide/nickel transport system ATP-binding protein n=1 Tax=Saccharopolyspora spinosa TaxID=60894 RepID=A0A2N3Y0X5_SACSN|nr:ATP-binding cassette domain-containing protein [Saccharopolyspora spinosa]PKW16578.1 peptide/nickel transport system ATP-binding protein [Saccharopolyspora spinosa]
MSTPILSARDLHACADTRPLLVDLDIDVLPGEITAAIGESGSGKTTLGLALQGESRPGIALTGAVELRGVQLLGLPATQRRAIRATAIGYLPQHPAAVLNPVRRVGSVLDELAAVRCATSQERAAAVAEALEAARLDSAPDLLRRYPHQLSGGQQQRIALAQVLLGRPEVLVLDEPATGLDSITKAETVETLTRMSSRGTAMVLLTHDLWLARRLADQVVVLQDGRIVERGPASRLLAAPSHAHTRNLLAAEPRLPTTPRDEPAGQTGAGLSARGLAKTARNGTRLLDGIDLDVPPGRCIAVAGRSGAGKTTLARCLAGLTRPDTGQVLLDGVPLATDIKRRGRSKRTRVQYVHQDARASFDEFRPVLAQVARTAQLACGLGREKARIEAASILESLGLSASQATRRPGALSGGQLQRAALARALLARPVALICDEITSGQDLINQAELLDLLAETVRTAAVGLVLISHDLPAVAAIADEIHVLEAGRCVEHSPTQVLLTEPRTTVARELVDSASGGDATTNSGLMGREGEH